MKKILTIVGVLLFGIIGFWLTPPAQSASQTVSLQVEFVDPISISLNTHLNFGLVENTIADSSTLIMSTAGNITGTGSASAVGATHSEANLDIHATAGHAFTIVLDDSATAGTYWAVSNWLSNYNGAGDVDPTGAGSNIAAPIADATLTIGATITITGAAAATPEATDNDTFDVTITYD